MTIKKRGTAFASIIFLTLSALGFFAFNYIGSYVDEEGFLQEPFALIPLSWLSLIIGLFLLVIACIGQFSKK